jgi:hypothetical protein
MSGTERVTSYSSSILIKNLKHLLEKLTNFLDQWASKLFFYKGIIKNCKAIFIELYM